MFFSAKQLWEVQDKIDLKWQVAEFDRKGYNGELTLTRVKAYVKACKKAILARETQVGWCYVGKWHRPWQVVPELQSFSAPDGQYAIGVEVEMGFNSREDARFIANKVQHWKHIALDYEGGSYPIEATFPPFLYSKLSSKRQPFRYLSLLRKNESLVFKHEEDDCVGTHINVSRGKETPDDERCMDLSGILEDLDYETKDKYFGRDPYGYCYGDINYIEFKLFNSTTCSKTLRKYIHVAVALADIIYSDVEITEEVVLAALQSAHKKR